MKAYSLFMPSVHQSRAHLDNINLLSVFKFLEVPASAFTGLPNISQKAIGVTIMEKQTQVISPALNFPIRSQAVHIFGKEPTGIY